MDGPLSRRQVGQVLSYDDARAAARGVLPRFLFRDVEHGSEDELTLERNRQAFAEVRLLPRMAVENPAPKIRTSLFGTDLDLPVLIAPMARSRLVHPDGDLGVARAAAAAGTIQVVASGSGFPLERVCPEGGGPKWFQVSRLVSWELTEHLAERAEHAGYRALVVTVDAPVSGSRERSRRDVRYSPVENALRFAPELVARPGWLYRFWRDGMPAKTPNTEGWTVSGNAIPRSARGAVNHSNAPTWAEIARLRALWSGPLLLKGILAPDDARRAEDVGANGIMVSNHGGRQLDGAPGALDALPGVVDAVGGRLEVLLDGGIRRGTDVVKALALGARAVLVGRFAMWSLAIGGQAGVERMLAILRSDLVRTMQLIGCTTVDELDGRWLFR